MNRYMKLVLGFCIGLTCISFTINILVRQGKIMLMWNGIASGLMTGLLVIEVFKFERLKNSRVAKWFRRNMI